jgi:hypothetical protein
VRLTRSQANITTVMLIANTAKHRPPHVSGAGSIEPAGGRAFADQPVRDALVFRASLMKPALPAPRGLIT